MVRSPVVVGLSLCRTEIRYAVRKTAEIDDGPAGASLTVGTLFRSDADGAESDAVMELINRHAPDMVRIHRADSDEIWTGPEAWNDEELELLAAPSPMSAIRVIDLKDGVASIARILRCGRHDDPYENWIRSGGLGQGELAGAPVIEWTDPDLCLNHPLISGFPESVGGEGGDGGGSGDGAAAVAATGAAALVIHASARRVGIIQCRHGAIMNACMFEPAHPDDGLHALALRHDSLPWMRMGRPMVRLFGERAEEMAEAVRILYPGAAVDSAIDLAGDVDWTHEAGPGSEEGWDRYSAAVILSRHPDGARA